MCDVRFMLDRLVREFVQIVQIAQGEVLGGSVNLFYSVVNFLKKLAHPWQLLGLHEERNGSGKRTEPMRFSSGSPLASKLLLQSGLPARTPLSTPPHPPPPRPLFPALECGRSFSSQTLGPPILQCLSWPHSLGAQNWKWQRQGSSPV